MTNSISQPIPNILEYKFLSDQETAFTWIMKFHNNLDKEKDTLYEKMMSSIPQPLEVIREPNNIETEAVSNPATQLGEGQNPWSEFQS